MLFRSAAAGTPIANTDVGLEGDPQPVRFAEGKTDARGSVTLGNLAPGRYAVFVPDLAIFKGPMVFAISVNGAVPVISQTLRAARGKAYAMGQNGSKLVFAIDKPNGRIVVTIFDRWRQ